MRRPALAPFPFGTGPGANSMIVSLGLMPALPQYPIVEVYTRVACPEYAVRGRMVLQSSDAHRLEDIAERTFALDVSEPTAQAVLAMLREQFRDQE